MPAAAVIPALIAYVKVVAIKKLVVGLWSEYAWSGVNAPRLNAPLFGARRRAAQLHRCVVRVRDIYCEQI